MPILIDRRQFLARSGRTAFAASLLNPTGFAQRSDAPASSVPAGIVEYLDRRIPELLRETKVPGLAFAVVRDARLVWQHAYGVTDIETAMPVADDTIFEAGSLSKPVFAYAVLKLCDRGVLSLDTPLVKYSSIRPLSDPRVDEITVRRVLSHTTGLPNFRADDEPLGFAFTPGERWLYSGEAYWYLQSVMTDLTGRVDATRCSTFEAGLRVCATDIGEYLKRNVLTPFGMTSSGYLWNGEYEKRVAQGHDEAGVRMPRRRADAINNARYAAVGGLHTTVGEFARFLLEVINPKPADAYRLSRALRDEMIRPQVRLDASQSWALGWQIFHGADGDLIGHSGDNPGFKSFVLASVPKKCGWMMFMNGDNARQIFLELIDATCPLNSLFTLSA